MKLPRASLATLGFVLIWTFLIVFVLFPLTRIFYDAFTNQAGQLSLANFYEFFTDSFDCVCSADSGPGVPRCLPRRNRNNVAFLIVRYDFPYRNLFSYLTMLPMILPPLVASSASFSFSPCRHAQRPADDWFACNIPSTSCTACTACCCRNSTPVSDDDAQHSRRPAQSDPSLESSTERGARGCAGSGHHLSADDAGYVSGAARLHRPSPISSPPWSSACRIYSQRSLSQYRPVRRPSHLPHGNCDLSATRSSAIAFVLAARQYVRSRTTVRLPIPESSAAARPVKRQLAVGFSRCSCSSLSSPRSASCSPPSQGLCSRRSQSTTLEHSSR